jgi:hypothetical protein
MPIPAAPAAIGVAASCPAGRALKALTGLIAAADTLSAAFVNMKPSKTTNVTTS